MLTGHRWAPTAISAYPDHRQPSPATQPPSPVMSVNQKQIAEALNLSVITVSRALRGHPDLAPDTKERVLKKAAELGYTKKRAFHTNTLAAPHRTSERQRAGIIIYENDEAPDVDLLKSHIMRRIFLSLQKECQRLEIETMIETAAPTPPTIPQLVRNGTVNCVFLLGRFTAETIKQLGDFPALAVSSFIECPGLPRIVADNFHGAYLATEHLIKLGHRQIIFVGYMQKNTQIFKERSYGYIAAMHDYGLTPYAHLHSHLHPHRDGMVPMDLISRYSAAMCSSDMAAYQLQHQLHDAGWKLPERFSIAGFDNNMLNPGAIIPITSYEPDWDQMGKTAVHLLFSHLLEISNTNMVMTIPGKLVVHASTCKPPADFRASGA